jgi:hypothetical protein
VALEKTFRELGDVLHRLRDNLLSIQLNIREDIAVEGAVVLVDKLGDAVDDSPGSLEEALVAADEALNAVASLRLDIVARALTKCQEQFQLLELRFQSELISYERLTDLTAFARSRRGEWLVWVKSVRQGLEQCKQPIDETSKALLACWQEIAERGAGSGSGTVNYLQWPECSKTVLTGAS